MQAGIQSALIFRLSLSTIIRDYQIDWIPAYAGMTDFKAYAVSQDLLLSATSANYQPNLSRN